MEPIKDLSLFRKELLALVSAQIAIRQYLLDELRAPMSSRELECEINKLDEIRTQIFNLGKSMAIAT